MFAINPPNTPVVGANGRMDPAWYRFFSQIQKVVGGDELSVLQRSPYITFEQSTNLSRSKVLIAAEPLDLSVGDTAEISLSPSGVTAGDYGSEAKTIAVSLDEFGRVMDAEEFDLNTDNIVEGATNLFFTQTRARESLSAGDGIDYDDATGVIAAQPAGVAPVFTAYPGATISAIPTQAEAQALADGLQAAAAALTDLIAKLQANGNLT